MNHGIMPSQRRDCRRVLRQAIGQINDVSPMRRHRHPQVKGQKTVDFRGPWVRLVFSGACWCRLGACFSEEHEAMVQHDMIFFYFRRLRPHERQVNARSCSTGRRPLGHCSQKKPRHGFLFGYRRPWRVSINATSMTKPSANQEQKRDR